jgi:lipopolysaccharide transport system permease protein
MGWLVTALLFSAPVLYPLSNLPQPYRHWLYLNPLTWVVETWRHVIYWGAWPDWGAALGFGLSGALIACWGAWCFERMKRGFADVL